MKLDIPYKVVGDIDTNLVNSISEKIVDEDWLLYDYRKAMGFNECQSILLRHSSEYSSDTIRNMPLFGKYAEELTAVVEHLKQYYSFNEYVAFIAKLEPNGKIRLHKDSGEFLEDIHRIHIPLQTAADCFYLVEDAKVNMEVGKMYEIDNTRVHGVENNSSVPRIHLVVNLYPTSLGA